MSTTSSQTDRIMVGLIMGSASDLPVVEEAEIILKNFGIPYATTVASAHRTPELVRNFVKNCEKRGAQVFIAAAGGAAALPGVVAADTIKPVIGVPITSTLSGLDSLLSIAQMPAGIPVATVAIGKAGARNAALLATAMLAIADTAMATRLTAYRADQRTRVENDAKKLESRS